MKKQRIPTWLLERIIVDEVPPERADEVRAILDSDPDERARLAELERSNAEILAALPPARVAAEVARRAQAERGYAFLFGFARSGAPRGRVHRRVLALSSSLAVAGAVVVGVVVGRQVGWPDPSTDGVASRGQLPPERPEEVTAKGPARLLLHRMRGEQVEPITSGDPVRAGDRIQVFYLSGGATHGVILSIDGRGHVEQHFPARDNGTTLLERPEGSQEQQVRLDHSYELDDAPGFERFVIVSSDHPIDLAMVRASAETLARDDQRRGHDTLHLPDGFEQKWYTLVKKEAAP